MPYRRLPKTDQARLAALRVAIAKGNKDGVSNPIVPLRLQQEAKTLFAQYEQALTNYKQSVGSLRANANKAQANTKMLRLYLSHFIQVLNMSIARGEIKKSNRTYYELEVENASVPDLISEKALMKWGERIILGEAERMRNGGSPIYNPNIAKVRVYYDIFKEKQAEHKIFQQSTKRFAEALNKFREKCDELILSVWNEVEAHYLDCSWPERLAAGREYGLIYYYRRGEKIDGTVCAP